MNAKLDATEAVVPSHVSFYEPQPSATLPLVTEDDNDMNLFFQLEGEDEPQHPSDSSKKWRFEEGEEHSSTFTY